MFLIAEPCFFYSKTALFVATRGMRDAVITYKQINKWKEENATIPTYSMPIYVNNLNLYSTLTCH